MNDKIKPIVILVLDVLKKHLNVQSYRIFLFGSWAEGTALEHSDVDIGIEGLEPINSSLWLDIQEDIEALPYMRKVELVDFCRVTDDFKKIALQNTEDLQ